MNYLKIFPASLLFVLTLSCKHKASKANKTIEAKKEEITTPISIDNDSLKIVGQRILSGQKIWGKNEKYLEDLMSHLTVGDSVERSFYFKVFSKITEQSDGYVAEAVGSAAMKYFEFSPNEFIENSNLISEKAFNSMAYSAGLEIAMTTNDVAEAEEEFEKIRDRVMPKFANASKYSKEKIDQFFNQMKQGIDPKIVK